MLNQEAHPAHDCGMANIQRFNNILARFPLPEEPDSTKARANVFRRRFVPEFVKKLRIRRQFCELVGNLVWFSHHPTFYGRLSGHASGRHDSRAYRICQIYLGREMQHSGAFRRGRQNWLPHLSSSSSIGSNACPIVVNSYTAEPAGGGSVRRWNIPCCSRLLRRSETTMSASMLLERKEAR